MERQRGRESSGEGGGDDVVTKYAHTNRHIQGSYIDAGTSIYAQTLSRTPLEFGFYTADMLTGIYDTRTIFFGPFDLLSPCPTRLHLSPGNLFCSQIRLSVW